MGTGALSSMPGRNTTSFGSLVATCPLQKNRLRGERGDVAPLDSTTFSFKRVPRVDRSTPATAVRISRVGSIIPTGKAPWCLPNTTFENLVGGYASSRSTGIRVALTTPVARTQSILTKLLPTDRHLYFTFIRDPDRDRANLSAVRVKDRRPTQGEPYARQLSRRPCRCPIELFAWWPLVLTNAIWQRLAARRRNLGEAGRGSSGDECSG